MKKFICSVLALLMLGSAAADCANCNCLTETARAAILDVVSVDDLQITDDQRDILLRAYSGESVECKKLKYALINVLTVNYEQVAMNINPYMYEAILQYISSCCCDDSEATEYAAPTFEPGAVG